VTQAAKVGQVDTDALCAAVDPERLRDVIVAMTDIASPTGEETALAEWLTGEAQRTGLVAHTQLLQGRQANSVASLSGSGGGQSLLLYAPIDTVGAGNADEDMPWIADSFRADHQAHAVVDGRTVVGLGASNPKGHAACVLVALETIARAGIAVRGNVIAGFGAGGMPTDPRPALATPHEAHGYGCARLVESLGAVDAAVIAKPGWNVSHEEVGFVWFELTVRGTHSYVGSRHRIDYRSAIADAAIVVTELEAWFPEYAARHTSHTVAPQAVVGAIEAGWMRMPAFPPASARILVDVRISPYDSTDDVIAEFIAQLDAIRATHHGLDVSCRPTTVFAGERTDPAHPIVTHAVGAFEAQTGSVHHVITGNSGSTDALILRAHGIPTVRIGMPKVSRADIDADFELGMNTVDIDAMAELTRILIRTAVGWCA
jgi:acetylornithine deacetylase/succinyl-diaminopimelate desuccinylase-like protein